MPLTTRSLVPVTLLMGLFLAACAVDSSSSDADGDGDETSDTSASSALVTSSAIQHVFVIAMENNSANTIYGNTTDCPYINGTLMKSYAYSGGSSATSSNFLDELAGSIPSEPHYIWIEAGTNRFADTTFTGDSPPSASNSTSSTAHLTKRLDAAGVMWRAYEEGLDAMTGACPVANGESTTASSYVARHNPFVFFRDVAFTNGQPDKNKTYCKNHIKSYAALATDLANNTVANYNFVTPNLCHDMHVQGCGSQTASQKRRAGDTWLKNNLPAMIAYANAHQGVIFITWDEPEGTNNAPFLVVGPHLKSAGYRSTLRYDHSSLLKSLQRILTVSPAQGVGYLGHAADTGTNDFGDFFQSGFYP